MESCTHLFASLSIPSALFIRPPHFSIVRCLHSGKWVRILIGENFIHITTSRTEHLIAYPQHSIGPLQDAAAPSDRLLFEFWWAGPFGGREPGPILLTYLDGGGRSTPSLLDTVVVIGRHERQGHKAFV